MSGPTALSSPLHWSAYRGDLRITWILLKVCVLSDRTGSASLFAFVELRAIKSVFRLLGISVRFCRVPIGATYAACRPCSSIFQEEYTLHVHVSLRKLVLPRISRVHRCGSMPRHGGSVRLHDTGKDSHTKFHHVCGYHRWNVGRRGGGRGGEGRGERTVGRSIIHVK